MFVSIGARPDASAALARLERVLVDVPRRIVACSGGVDSMLLATVAHRAAPTTTTVAHTVTPAVPGDGTARVAAAAEREGWDLEIVHSTEFDDERYLSNPTDRCYFCKSNLYDAVAALGVDGPVVLSGANLDDLGEYRPGLVAAAEREVRHPFVEASITKAEIRSAARSLGLPEADLPASPCLASRLYTGTRVTASRLRAVEAGESLVRSATGIDVVRCRIRETTGAPAGSEAAAVSEAPAVRETAAGDGVAPEAGLDVLVEVGDDDRRLVTVEVLAHVLATMRRVDPTVVDVRLDDDAYEPGRAFVGAHGVGMSGPEGASDAESDEVPGGVGHGGGR